MKTDPVSIEILRNLVIAIAEEMGVVLKRTAHSPNIKERMDASCALFDEQGRLFAQADHIPVHLGSMPPAIQAIVDHWSPEQFEPGDQFIMNDPYSGGTHLPDITLIKPVFLNTKHIGYTVCKAHHSDVGGMTPCSMPAFSSDIHQEGLLLPPIRLIKSEVMSGDVLSIILANTRTPEERLGDLKAQIAANNIGAKRFETLMEKYSLSLIRDFIEDIINYSEIRVQKSLQNFKTGVFQAEERLEPDPISNAEIILKCSVTVNDNHVFIDFSGSSPQTKGNLNAPLAVTRSAVYYVFRCLTDPEIPPNHGSYRSITITVPEASVLNPDRGCAVVAGNVETSQRIVDLLFKAFCQSIPDKVPAQSQGTMNNITFGGVDKSGKPFTYYETIGGGEGAYPFRHGQDGIHVHMTNTANTPAEVIEEDLPLRVVEYSLRKINYGEGKFHGGRGISRKIEVLADNTTCQIISERRHLNPSGLAGGKPGPTGRNSIIRNNRRKNLPSKTTVTLNQGDIIHIQTPGGGGYGNK